MGDARSTRDLHGALGECIVGRLARPDERFAGRRFDILTGVSDPSAAFAFWMGLSHAGELNLCSRARGGQGSGGSRLRVDRPRSRSWRCAHPIHRRHDQPARPTPVRSSASARPAVPRSQVARKSWPPRCRDGVDVRVLRVGFQPMAGLRAISDSMSMTCRTAWGPEA